MKNRSMQRSEPGREDFRNPRAERHYRNKQREMEKSRRHEPVGRLTWEEAEA